LLQKCLDARFCQTHWNAVRTPNITDVLTPLPTDNMSNITAVMKTPAHHDFSALLMLDASLPLSPNSMISAFHVFAIL